MPSVPTPLEISMMNSVMAADGARRMVMRRAFNAYMGTLPRSKWARRQLVTEPGSVDDNVPINVIKPAVHAIADFLMGMPPIIDIPEAQDATNTDTESPEELWLNECRRVNNWNALMLKEAKNASIFGTSYIAIDTVNTFPNNLPGGGPPFPRLVLRDSYDMAIVWDPYNVDRTIGYVWRSTGASIHEPYVPLPVYEYQVVRQQENGTWLITDSYQDMRGNPPQSKGPPTIWPYPWPPILHRQNEPTPNTAYGDPDVDEVLIQLNEALAYNVSKRQRIQRKHAHPKFITQGVDHVLNPEDDVWELPEDATATLLHPHIDATAGAELTAEIYEAILEYLSVPSIIMGKADAMRITSGVSQLVRMAPAIRRATTRRLLIEPFLQELCRRLFELAGFGRNIIVKVTWPELVPTDPLTKRQIATTDINVVGIKREVVAVKLGYELSDLEPIAPAQMAPPAKPGPGNIPGAPDTNNTNTSTSQSRTGTAA